MSNESVLLDIENGIATITLNGPNSLNALSYEIVDGLESAIQKVKTDSSVRTVILTGNGKGFCAGGDIRTFPESSNGGVGRAYMQNIVYFLKELANLEKPVIAAVNGFAVGAGFSLALACDFVVASEKARFSMGFTKVGVVPDLGALYHLPRVVGMARAKQLAYSDKMLSAQESVDYGISLEVVEQDNLLNRTREIASSFANGPSYSIGLTKAILNQSYESTLEDILKEEAMAQAISFSTDDHKEGVKAFFEKRPPQFTGK